MTLTERIEAAFDAVIASKAQMHEALYFMDLAEESARMDNIEEWASAKNNDVRRAIVLRELADNEDYHAARTRHRDNRDGFRLGMLEVERLKLLVAADGR